MKALRVHGFDGVGQWQIDELVDPQLSPDDVLVQVEAASVSYVDLLLAQGRYQIRPDPPFVPGTEFCGVITACGSGAANMLQPGQRVVGTVFGGAWAERVSAHWRDVTPVACADDARAACTLPITYATARYALKGRGDLQPGETVLVLGATGGVGIAAVQVARAMGARVVAAAQGSLKCSAAMRLGADFAVDTSRDSWRADLKAVAEQGIDLVVDPIGGPLTETAFRSLRWGGRHLVVGFAHGLIPALPANLPLLKGAAFIGVDVRQFREREPEAARDNLKAVVQWFSRRVVIPELAGVYPIGSWPAAMNAAARRETLGRVVLDWTSLK